jgi:hypothetical protein
MVMSPVRLGKRITVLERVSNNLPVSQLASQSVSQSVKEETLEFRTKNDACGNGVFRYGLHTYGPANDMGFMNYCSHITQ